MNHKKIINRLLSTHRVAKHLGWRTFVKASKSEMALEILEKPAKGRVLVLAPHPDDEVLGVGGTLLKHAAEGSRIRLVFVSSGERGKETPVKPDAALGQIRAKEAIAVAKKLEAEITFLQQPDLGVEGGRICKQIADLIVEFKPDFIYCPTAVDDHPDHQQTAYGLRLALEIVKDKVKLSEIKLFFYEVWAPLYMNRVVLIDADAKMNLIQLYQSQLKIRRYDEAILGLNVYRGIISGANKPAEAFFATPADLWLKLK